MELKKETLGDRIKKLRLAFQKPYYVFSVLSNGEIFLIFENEEGERMSFRERTMVGAVKKAEDFLEASRIRAGQEETRDKIPEKKDSRITVETKIRDGEGKEYPDSN